MEIAIGQQRNGMLFFSGSHEESFPVVVSLPYVLCLIFRGWTVQSIAAFAQVTLRLGRGRFAPSKRRVSWIHALVSLFFLSCSVGFAAGAGAAMPQRSASRALTAKLNSHFTIADFDGDQQADLATVQAGAFTSSQSRYWIRFQLTGGARQSFGITAPAGGLELSARDVNGDNILDVIVSTTWLNRPVAILLNDGRGKFALVDPSEFPNVVWSAENSRTLNAPLSNENGVLSLSRYPVRAFDGRSCLTPRLNASEALGPADSRGPAFPDYLLRHGRAPPTRIHHV
jgi:hypothetical protein